MVGWLVPVWECREGEVIEPSVIIMIVFVRFTLMPVDDDEPPR